MSQEKREIDNQVFFKRYRNTTLVDHLGNFLGSITIQKHHLIETKRPKAPLELPNSRYRTRFLERKLRQFSNLSFNFSKRCLQMDERGYL